jgi:hypothetical protein
MSADPLADELREKFPEEGIAETLGLAPIDWPTFWSRPPSIAEYVIEPTVPKGRAVAVYSKPKGSKSLLFLDATAAAVTGRSIFGQPARPAIRVVYLDMEMTEDDLRERLEDLGYGPADDLSGLAYYQLPSMPPLDSVLGGEVLLEAALNHQTDLVVLDTMARAVSGDENSADTYRAFYRNTGQRLKAAGVALLRLDHQGKEAERGQRGSSSKADDVDVVWHLTTVSSKRLILKRTHTRVPWVPAEVSIDRYEEPHLRHVLAPVDSWPAGTAEVAAALDDLKVPLDAPVRSAMSALKESGRGRSTALVTHALKYRRIQP